MGSWSSIGIVIIYFFMIGLPILFLRLVFIKNISKALRIFFFILLGCSVGYSIRYFKNSYDHKKESEREFIGLHTLLKYNGKTCLECTVTLHPDNTYDIIQKNKKTGKGRWQASAVPETGSRYLKNEGERIYMAHNNKGTIISIDTHRQPIVR